MLMNTVGLPLCPHSLGLGSGMLNGYMIIPTKRVALDKKLTPTKIVSYVGLTTMPRLLCAEEVGT